LTGAAATGDAHAGTIADPVWTGTPVLLAESAAAGFRPVRDGAALIEQLGGNARDAVGGRRLASCFELRSY
jgi:hypothetical protein